MCDGCRNKAGIIGELEEEIRQLRAMNLGADIRLPLEWGLTAAERAIVCCLVQRPIASRDALAAAMRVLKHDWSASLKTFDTWICKIRPKLAPHGVTIKTLNRIGFAMDEASRRRFSEGLA